MRNNYDKIAIYYDRLSRLVFFKTQLNAQRDQLQYILPCSSILIVGGGTGWILEDLCSRYPAGLTITYVEISGNMIALAKKRNLHHNKVHFIHAAIEDYTDTKTFDVVMTAFLFDNFSAAHAQQVFHQLHKLLKPGCLWLYADFNPRLSRNHLWKKLLLKVMYLFFRNVAQVETSVMTDMSPHFKSAGFEILLGKDYYNHFIEAIVYRKAKP